jgi:hypothetical protein
MHFLSGRFRFLIYRPKWSRGRAPIALRASGGFE